MQQFLTIIHILAAVFLIVLVLMQKGKGSDMGAGFGGASQTIFGSQGTTPFLVKLTGFLAFVFFITCGTLSFFINSSHAPVHDILDDIPLAQQPIKKEPMIPIIEQAQVRQPSLEKTEPASSADQTLMRPVTEAQQLPDKAVSVLEAPAEDVQAQPSVVEQDSVEQMNSAAEKLNPPAAVAHQKQKPVVE
jgi:preprotein translocase subunit SecG